MDPRDGFGMEFLCEYTYQGTGEAMNWLICKGVIKVETMLRDAVGENEEGNKMNRITNDVNHTNLLCLSVTTRSVIGQFCGPYFTVQPAKFPD